MAFTAAPIDGRHPVVRRRRAAGASSDRIDGRGRIAAGRPRADAGRHGHSRFHPTAAAMQASPMAGRWGDGEGAGAARQARQAGIRCGTGVEARGRDQPRDGDRPDIPAIACAADWNSCACCGGIIG
ncbi:hypothetical protein KX924_11255 [Streptomyces sp. II-2-2-2]